MVPTELVQVGGRRLHVFDAFAIHFVHARAGIF